MEIRWLAVGRGSAFDEMTPALIVELSGFRGSGLGLHVPLGQAAAVALADSPLFASLSHLNVDNCGLGPAEVARLACPAAANLRSLILQANVIGEGGAEAVVRSEALAGLRRLDLSYCKLGDGATGALAGARMTNLTRLDLPGNDISDGKALAGSPVLGRLAWLDLSFNEIRDEGGCVPSRRRRFRAGSAV